MEFYYHKKMNYTIELTKTEDMVNKTSIKTGKKINEEVQNVCD